MAKGNTGRYQAFIGRTRGGADARQEKGCGGQTDSVKKQSGTIASLPSIKPVTRTLIPSINLVKIGLHKPRSIGGAARERGGGLTAMDGRSSIPAHKNGSFISINASNAKKRELMETELGRIRNTRGSTRRERDELSRRQKNVIHQLNTLDALEGKPPKPYVGMDSRADAKGSIPKPDTERKVVVPGSGKPEVYANARAEYGEYAKQARTPNADEYQQMVKAGANMSYDQYVHWKLNSQTQSFEQFSQNRAVGRPDSQTIGGVTVEHGQSAAYYSDSGSYTPANAPAAEYMHTAGADENKGSGYKFHHNVGDFNVEGDNTFWDEIRHTKEGTLFETNCYALALDLTSFPDGSKFSSDRDNPKYALQPGMLSPGKTPEHYYTQGKYFYSADGIYSALVQAMKDDVSSLGKKMVSYDSEKCDRKAGYVIAVAVGYKGDAKNFHCMRLNSDDMWESKDGSNKAIEIGGNTPPEKIMSDMGYSEFVGLFFIE